eukprot:607276-Prymnesium_polylepis.1
MVVLARTLLGRVTPQLRRAVEGWGVGGAQAQRRDASARAAAFEVGATRRQATGTDHRHGSATRVDTRTLTTASGWARRCVQNGGLRAPCAAGPNRPRGAGH